ncbi:M20 metallopeptidase family protein [Acidaminobacterium chupaoyuni]
MDILEKAKAMEDEIIAWRRYFHQNPELGMDLPKTAAKVKEELEKMGVEYREAAPNAIMAFIGPKGGRSILLRGDMDALPLQEATGLPYASQTEGKMHACGHDTHTAMLLGAAKLLKEQEARLEGLAMLMFQPGEETLEGAKAMIEAGALETPRPDYAMALHIAGMPLKTGQVKIASGPCAASSDCYRIVLHGKGGHGASPQKAINPIFAAAKIIEAFTDLGRYEIDPQMPSVVNTCAIHSGTIYNVIPNDCEIKGTVRMFNEENRARILKRMQETAEKIADLYRCGVEWHIDLAAPSNYSNEVFARTLHGWLTSRLTGAEIKPLSTEKMMGSEDFAYVSQLVPSCAVELGAGSPQIPDYPAHHPMVQFDEKAFAYGTAVYAQAALSYLTKE